MIEESKSYSSLNGHTYKAYVIPGGSLYMIYRDGTFMGQTHGKEKLDELFEHMRNRDLEEQKAKE